MTRGSDSHPDNVKSRRPNPDSRYHRLDCRHAMKRPFQCRLQITRAFGKNMQSSDVKVGLDGLLEDWELLAARVGSFPAVNFLATMSGWTQRPESVV